MRAPKLKLISATEPGDKKTSHRPAGQARGVFHRVGLDGVTIFEMTSSRGVIRLEVRISANEPPAVGRKAARWLLGLLDELDPPCPTLEILR